MTRALPAVLIGAVTVLAALTGCGTSPADEQADLIVYSGREEELVAPVIEMFEQESGLDVETRYGDSAELAATLLEEGENSPADVFFSQDAGALGAVQNDDLLAQLPETTLDRVPAQFRSQAGNWVGISARARVIGYSTEVDAGELPESILDYTKPEWKGKVGWAPTNASLQTQITAMRDRIGDAAVGDWIEGMVANDAQVYPDNTAVRDAIANGEIDTGLLNHYYIAQAIAEEGDDYPVAIRYLTGSDPGSLVNVAGAAEIEGTNQRERAIEFIDFLLSDQAQEYFADGSKEYPLVPGVRADGSLRPLEEVEQPDLDLSDLDDLQGTLELMREHGAL